MEFVGGLTYCLSVASMVCVRLCCEVFFFSFYVDDTSHGSMYMWEICVCYHLMNPLIGLYCVCKEL